MNSRERVLRAIRYEEPDRVPLDGEFRREVWERFYEYYGTEDDEAVLRRLGIDIRYVSVDPPKDFKPISWFPPDSTKAYVNMLITWCDEWGIRLGEGKTGKYWHIINHPLAGLDTLDDYEFPDLDAPGRFEEARRQVKEWDGEYAVVGGALDGFFEHSWMLRGFREFMRDLYTNPRFVNELLDRSLEYEVEKAKRFIELGVDILCMSDDLGTQRAMMVGLDIWRRYFQPRYHRLIQAIKKAGDVYFFFHSDGYIEPIIPDLIEMGVDILDPIQPECMDPVKLKKLYGDRLTFHGTISLQETLPFGGREDVEREVITRIETLNSKGGLILAPSNRVGWDVPLENVLALYETAKRYKYKG